MLFSLYEEREAQTPLWQEAQDVHSDAQGHFQVLLGVTRKDGLPKSLFVDGKAHWLGIQLQPGQGQEAAGQQPSADEEERVLLLGVPYALKASDADTLGGLPASAYIHTAAAKIEPKTRKPSTGKDATADANSADPNAAPTGTGTTNYIARWISATALGNSFFYQTSTSIGIGTTTPVAKLHVIGPTPATTIDGYNNATSGSTFGILGQADSTTGTGVYGKAPAVTGATVGVRGIASSTSGTGLLGWDTATSGATAGVLGQVASKSGIAGVFNNTAGGKVLSGRNNGAEVFSVDGAGTVSASGGNFNGQTAITANGSSAGLSAFSDSGTGITAGTLDGVAIHASTAMSYGGPTAMFEGRAKGAIIATGASDGADNPGLVISAGGDGSYQATGRCVIDSMGNLACSGTKSAAVKTATGHQVAMYAVEAPENWFEDFGSAKLASGIATVKLEPTFTQTVNSAQDYHVFLTPNGDCKGLYVSRKTPTSFEVRELGGGQSSVSFDFRIVVRRKGYENVRMADLTKKMTEPVFRTKTGQLKQIAAY
jgi:hypothetical protein